MSNLIIAGREFSSRLFLGTGKFNNNSLMASAIQASETEMVTVAMKRIELNDQHDDLLTHITQNQSIQLLPNTSGVRNAEEAVFAAQMSREAFGTNWLKLEIHPDPRYLLPDSIETLKATENCQAWLCSVAILPGRPHSMQAPRRSRRCHSDASRRTYWHKQGIANERLPANHHRASKRACGGRCWHRCTEPCSRSNGDGCRRMPCQYRHSCGRRPRTDGYSL